MELKDIKCSTCRHWKNKQRELHYSTHTGICTNGKFEYNTRVGRLISVLDSTNPNTGVIGHQVETLGNKVEANRSRYALATEEEFGCIYYES